MTGFSRVFGGCRTLMAKATTNAAATGIVAESELSRATAVKKVWEHIKGNNLQNPENRKEIICDDKLKTIFEGKDKVGFTEIAKLLSPHFPKSV
ncbi:BnaA09g25180D [Brassica napus]|uniref:BnaA09g25180D protein n=1 Tax=Brassica napus TaxID=3708 RepID=A0A078IGP7_BRANA|nr:BnaA09g25180D [Brassica napus]